MSQKRSEMRGFDQGDFTAAEGRFSTAMMQSSVWPTLNAIAGSEKWFPREAISKVRYWVAPEKDAAGLAVFPAEGKGRLWPIARGNFEGHLTGGQFARELMPHNTAFELASLALARSTVDIEYVPSQPAVDYFAELMVEGLSRATDQLREIDSAGYLTQRGDGLVMFMNPGGA